MRKITKVSHKITKVKNFKNIVYKTIYTIQYIKLMYVRISLHDQQFETPQKFVLQHNYKSNVNIPYIFIFEKNMKILFLTN